MNPVPLPVLHSEFAQSSSAWMWKAADISVVFSTVDRKPSYLQQTLESFLNTDQMVRQIPLVTLVSGSLSEAHLAGIPESGRFSVRRMTAPEWEKIRDMKIHQRALVNYHRCLTLPEGSWRGLLVCEDDVKFRPGFMRMLVDALNEMSEAGHTEFILACYATHDFDKRPSAPGGRTYSSYPANRFYGTQAVFYTRNEAAEVAGELHTCGVVKYEKPYDLVIQNYARRRPRLFSTRLSLAQHIGRVTTGLGGFHWSPTFDRPWPEKPAA